MYPIGSYAVPQILSVNPNMNIDSFTFPANENEEDNVLNSGIDLHFSVMKNTKNKEAVYEVLRFLFKDETVQIYLDEQSGIPCNKMPIIPLAFERGQIIIRKGLIDNFTPAPYNAFAGQENWTTTK